MLVLSYDISVNIRFFVNLVELLFKKNKSLGMENIMNIRGVAVTLFTVMEELEWKR
ncbi:hypothetical protein BAOM_4419 [Peribacillus asahii]|uniref:Uncharacterized protein n=1 Tax=Peribacillus asahii TaxID=228899 RepID=A0A3T0KXF7_9BACI|nr:hypothetical protein BAOM_4419 [Peribacillus asahii]